MATAGRKTSDPWAQAGIYTSLGFVLFGGIAGGYFAGWLLDSWLGTKPVLSMLVAAVGFVGAFIEVLRVLERLEKREGGNNHSS